MRGELEPDPAKVEPRETAIEFHIPQLTWSYATKAPVSKLGPRCPKIRARLVIELASSEMRPDSSARASGLGPETLLGTAIAFGTLRLSSPAMATGMALPWLSCGLSLAPALLRVQRRSSRAGTGIHPSHDSASVTQMAVTS
jgi:hypothetical protein